MKIQSLLPALLLYAAYANAADNIRIEYMPAETTHDKLAEQSIQSSDVNPIFVRLSQAYFPFRKPLTLIYGGEDGPMYDPDTHTIHIPYTFYVLRFTWSRSITSPTTNMKIATENRQRLVH